MEVRQGEREIFLPMLAGKGGGGNASRCGEGIRKMGAGGPVSNPSRTGGRYSHY